MDAYAKGMIHYGQEQADCTPEYDRFQYGLFRQYVRGTVLEVGAGDGRITALALSGGELDQIVALEPSPHFFRLLQARVGQDPRVTLLEAETAAVRSQRPEGFDCAFSVHVMEHVADDRGFLEDMLAMTKPGGTVVVLVPALQWLYSDLDRSIGHFRRYDKKSIRRLVPGLNARIERMFYSNLIGVAASLYFVRLRKLDYQKNEQNKKRFFFLYSLFSKYAVPVVRVLEGLIAPPVGLNLTVVLRKSSIR
jgi:SAM-dependent methyltransferase